MLLQRLALVIGLAVLPFTALADGVFSWGHNGMATDGTDIPNEEIAFTIEYDIDGGTPVNIGIAPGALAEGFTTVQHIEAGLTLACGQTITARGRAVWNGVPSTWTLPATDSAPACPVVGPSEPYNFTVTIQ